MEIIYQGRDITEHVQTRRCIVTDTIGKRCDSIELEFENAETWFEWSPEEDDRIEVTHGQYRSGEMYLNMVRPENGIYKIVATSLPNTARRKITRTFSGKTIEEILRTCAVDVGMGYQIYGMDKDTIIPYIQQEDESSPAFLYRLLTWEGCAFKTVDGMYSAIDLLYAQDIDPCQTIELLADEQAQYIRTGDGYSGVSIKTPLAQATAVDEAVSGTYGILTMSPPVNNNIQAGRWARGKLLELNRQYEAVCLRTEFNQGMTALARVNIEGNTDAAGEWIAEKVMHDLVNLETAVKLHRCIRSIR